MMDLTRRGLPNVVEIDGSLYSIYTDFRVWMRFANQMKRLRRGEYIDVSYLFKNEMPSFCRIDVLMEFLDPKCELPRKKQSSSEIILDYEIDGSYIYAAFMSQYGIDLVEVGELHWHKFLALFKGLKEDEMICRIMAYRGYSKSNEKIDFYAEQKEAWRIEYKTEEELEEERKFSSLFE